MRKMSPVQLLDDQKHLSASITLPEHKKTRATKQNAHGEWEPGKQSLKKKKKGNERTSYKGLAMNLVSYKYEANLVAGGVEVEDSTRKLGLDNVNVIAKATSWALPKVISANPLSPVPQVR